MSSTFSRAKSLTLRSHTGGWAAAATFALAASACSKDAPPMQTPQVTVAPAVERVVADWDEFTGHFEAVNSVEVRPRVGGFLQRVGFTEGAIVHQGDVLFVIDQRPYEAEVARAEAVLAQARTRNQLAGMEVERAQKLVNSQAISREELDARTSGQAEGDAGVKGAQAAVRVARLNLEWTVVRAPITGRVGRAEITPGNVVQAGPPSPSLLTTIVSIDPIYVYFDTDEQAYLKYIGTNATGPKGRQVLIGLANETGFPHEGRLNFVDNRVNGASGTISARALLSNPNGLFTPGLFARVRLLGSARHLATLVQDQAIGTDQDRKFVLVLKSDNTVEYRPVVTGRVVDGLRTVESGLKPGERVVINGLMRVRPGMKVAATNAAMVAESAAPAPATR
ncbi:MAG TPA: efflux RND transporter periplasmic adaptor subunit [Gemmatimonadaceae bacterium]|nr:efflux RND transporter periplasmic adaptor subunit [Gemmatimonadaceae bacterium]